MSLYRILLATVAAVTLCGGAIADENAAQPNDNNAAMSNQQPAAGQPSASNVSNEISKININSASAKDLMKVKGINAARAKAIVAYRKKHGEFKSVDELSNVRGFNKLKSAKLHEIEAQIAVD